MPVASMMWLKAGSPCCRPTFTSSCASHLSHAQLQCQRETPAVERTLEETTFKTSNGFLSNMDMTNMELRRVSTDKHWFHMRIKVRGSMYKTIYVLYVFAPSGLQRHASRGALARLRVVLQAYIHIYVGSHL